MDEFSDGHAIFAHEEAMAKLRRTAVGRNGIAPRFNIRPAIDGDGVEYLHHPHGEWIKFNAAEALWRSEVAMERERCARLVEVLARSLDEHITGGIGDSARTVARYIRAGKQVKEPQ
jgi:hypothetical protein